MLNIYDSYSKSMIKIYLSIPLKCILKQLKRLPYSFKLLNLIKSSFFEFIYTLYDFNLQS